jgi:hypothetical protein
MFLTTITTDELKISLIIGIISSLIASGLFLALLFCLRPRISISSKIARVTTPEGEKRFVIKVVNRSFYKLIDVNVEFVILIPRTTSGGNNLKLEKLTLINDKIWFIDKRDNYLSTKSKYASYAVQFTCKDDLDEKWNSDGSSAHFKVICRHVLSGFSSVCTQQFFDKPTDIVTGRFKHGKCLEII